jgi:type I restriction enzyme S subunit
LAKWRLHSGDLVLTEGGDFDKLGRGTIWCDEIPNCIHQNHIFRVRPNQELISPEFLELEIRSPYGKGYFLSKAKKTTNLASINQAQLREFPVRFPSKSRQAAIVAEIGELHQRIQRLLQAQRESAQELAAMLPAALDRAFRGKM